MTLVAIRLGRSLHGGWGNGEKVECYYYLPFPQFWGWFKQHVRPSHWWLKQGHAVTWKLQSGLLTSMIKGEEGM